MTCLRTFGFTADGLDSLFLICYLIVASYLYFKKAELPLFRNCDTFSTG
jgi:hypothetical protein